MARSAFCTSRARCTTRNDPYRGHNTRSTIVRAPHPRAKGASSRSPEARRCPPGKSRAETRGRPPVQPSTGPEGRRPSARAIARGVKGCGPAAKSPTPADNRPPANSEGGHRLPPKPHAARTVNMAHKGGVHLPLLGALNCGGDTGGACGNQISSPGVEMPPSEISRNVKQWSPGDTANTIKSKLGGHLENMLDQNIQDQRSTTGLGTACLDFLHPQATPLSGPTPLVDPI